METKTIRQQSKYTLDLLQDVTKKRQTGKSVKALIGRYDQNNSSADDSRNHKPDNKKAAAGRALPFERKVNKLVPTASQGWAAAGKQEVSDTRKKEEEQERGTRKADDVVVVERAKSNISTVLQKQVTQRRDTEDWRRTKLENEMGIRNTREPYSSHVRSRSDREGRAESRDSTDKLLDRKESATSSYAERYSTLNSHTRSRRDREERAECKDETLDTKKPATNNKVERYVTTGNHVRSRSDREERHESKGENLDIKDSSTTNYAERFIAPSSKVRSRSDMAERPEGNVNTLDTKNYVANYVERYTTNRRKSSSSNYVISASDREERLKSKGNTVDTKRYTTNYGDRYTTSRRGQSSSASSNIRSKSDREETIGSKGTTVDTKQYTTNYGDRYTSSRRQNSIDNDKLSVTSLNEVIMTSTESSNSTMGQKPSTYARSSRHRRRDRSHNNPHDPGKRSVSVGKTSRDTSPWISDRKHSERTSFSFEDTEVFAEITHMISPRGVDSKERSDLFARREEVQQNNEAHQISHSTNTQSDIGETSTTPPLEDNAPETKVSMQDISGVSSMKQNDIDDATSCQIDSATFSPTATPQTVSAVKTHELIFARPFVKPFNSALSPTNRQGLSLTHQKSSDSLSDSKDEKSPLLKPIDISKYLIPPPSSATSQETQNPELMTSSEDQDPKLNADVDLNLENQQEPVNVNEDSQLPSSKALNEVTKAPPLPTSPPPPTAFNQGSLFPEHQTTTPVVPSTNQLQAPKWTGEYDIRDDLSDSVFLPYTQKVEGNSTENPKGTADMDGITTDKLKSVSFSEMSAELLIEVRKPSGNAGSVISNKSAKSDIEERLDSVESTLSKQLDESNKSFKMLFQLLSKEGSPDNMSSSNCSSSRQMQNYLYHKIFRLISKNMKRPWTEFMSALFETYPEWFVRWKEGDIRKENESDEDCVYTCLVLWRDLHGDLPDDVLIEELTAVCSRNTASLKHGIDNILRLTEDTKEKYLSCLDDNKLSSLALEIGPNEWKTLGMFLGHSYTQLQHLETNHHKNIGGAIQQMLVDWRNRHGADANQLVTGLVRCNRNDLLRFIKPIRY